MGFDGNRVFMLPRCARALETGYGVFTMDLIWGHRLGSRRETQMSRILKYADRGFGLRILASYVRSLENNRKDDVPLCDQDTSSTEGATQLTGSLRVPNNEPGLKTLRRIAWFAERFVYRYNFRPSRLIGLEGQDGPRFIGLPPRDSSYIDVGMPDVRILLGVFETIMRECAAWRLSAMYPAE